MNKGFITLHRQLLEWEWYKDVPAKVLFLHFLLNANYKPKNWKGIIINRGELLTGRLELSKNTGLSQQQIRTAIKKLKSTNEITCKSTNQYTLIKLVNYSLYQKEDKKSNQLNNQSATNEQPTDNQRITTTNKRNKETKKEPPLPPKNDKNVNNYVDNFSKKGVGVFKNKGREELKVDDIINKLDNTALLLISKNAMGWDKYNLAQIYAEGINNGTREPPNNINKAFPAWCKCYTKGKKL